jgi:hypothetical protein
MALQFLISALDGDEIRLPNTHSSGGWADLTACLYAVA